MRSIHPTIAFLLITVACLMAAGVRVAEAQFWDLTPPELADPGAGFGVAWNDYDKDGDPDLFLSNGSGNSKLWRNDGGTFVEETNCGLGGLGGEYGVAWGDYTGDGAPDLYVARGTGPNKLYRNDPNGQFADIPAGDAGDPGPTQSVACADYDQDGDLDIFVTNWDAPNRLFRNEGGGIYVDATPPGMDDPGKNSGAAWGDYDNDGDPDIYVGAYLYSKLFRNEGGGVFTDVTVTPLDKVGVTGVAWGDYDNDEDLDLYLSRDSRNRILRNDTTDSTTAFVDIAIHAIWDDRNSQGFVWADFDNDMDLDLFVVNAGRTNDEGASNAYFQNNGGNTFSAPPIPAVIVQQNSRGVALGDWDMDGWPDVYIANWFEPNQLLRKVGTMNHWLHIDLVGTESNSSAIGARVRVVAGGTAMIREISGGSGIYSQNALTAYFGLGGNTTADTVQVYWPSGIVTDSLNVAGDQKITLFETNVQVGIGNDQSAVPVARLYPNIPNPFRARTVIRYDLLEPSPVEIRIVDASGKLVRHITRPQLLGPGTYEYVWNGQGDGGRRLARGVYFFSLRTGRTTHSNRMILLR